MEASPSRWKWPLSGRRQFAGHSVFNQPARGAYQGKCTALSLRFSAMNNEGRKRERKVNSL
jgi:hypothetical protein